MAPRRKLVIRMVRKSKGRKKARVQSATVQIVPEVVEVSQMEKDRAVESILFDYADPDKVAQGHGVSRAVVRAWTAEYLLVRATLGMTNDDVMTNRVRIEQGVIKLLKYFMPRACGEESLYEPGSKDERVLASPIQAAKVCNALFQTLASVGGLTPASLSIIQQLHAQNPAASPDTPGSEKDILERAAVEMPLIVEMLQGYGVSIAGVRLAERKRA